MAVLLDLVQAWPQAVHVEALAERNGVWARTIRRDLHTLAELGHAAPCGNGLWVWGYGESTLESARRLFLRPLPVEERGALSAMAFGFKPQRQLRRAAGL